MKFVCFLTQILYIVVILVDDSGVNCYDLCIIKKNMQLYFKWSFELKK